MAGTRTDTARVLDNGVGVPLKVLPSPRYFHSRGVKEYPASLQSLWFISKFPRRKSGIHFAGILERLGLFFLCKCFLAERLCSRTR